VGWFREYAADPSLKFAYQGQLVRSRCSQPGAHTLAWHSCELSQAETAQPSPVQLAEEGHYGYGWTHTLTSVVILTPLLSTLYGASLLLIIKEFCNKIKDSSIGGQGARSWVVW